jgi:hypothetical protein
MNFIKKKVKIAQSSGRNVSAPLPPTHGCLWQNTVLSKGSPALRQSQSSVPTALLFLEGLSQVANSSLGQVCLPEISPAAPWKSAHASTKSI